jgi:hypothetical protein
MTSIPPVLNGALSLFSEISAPNFDVSWVGATGAKDGICFGSETGKITFQNPGDKSYSINNAIRTNEAVNGVAFFEHWIMVSSRNQVVLWTLPTDGSETLTGTPFPIGSHGVVASSSGHFVAPLGRSGLLFCRPRDGNEQSVDIRASCSNELNHYRVISVQAESGQEFIVCVLRRNGIGVMEFKGPDQRNAMTTATFGDLDVVDVCKTGSEAGSTAYAAVGRDGTLILFPDVRFDREPITVKYKVIEGTVYRLLYARGYLFVLTSKALYAIANLVDDANGVATGSPVTPILTLPMEAVDANIVGEKRLCIVLPDKVVRLDIEQLSLVATETVTDRRTGSMKPDWLRSELQHRSIEESALSVSAPG